MNQMTLDLRIDSHCRIGRIRFKRHRGREERKDKASIKAAFNATTAALTRARDLKSIGRGEGR